MAKTYGEKLKLLLIRDYLLRCSDEKHPVTIADIQAELGRHEITAERKSIYRDLKLLGCSAEDEEDCCAGEENLGMHIVSTRKGYYLDKRDFSLEEVKLLVDMVQSSHFITREKSSSLIKKLVKLVSVHEARSLERNVLVQRRIKAMNDSVFLNVDKIFAAINEDRILHFKYYSYNIAKEKVHRHDGAVYTVSPFALIWSDENYYLLGYSEEHGQMRHYRVDRMDHITSIKGPRKGKAEFKTVDLATYSSRVFHMFTGELRRIVLRFDRSLVDTVIDRFGIETMLVPEGESSFVVHLDIAASPQFFGWIAGFGNLAEIRAPEDIRQDYVKYLQSVLEQYQ